MRVNEEMKKLRSLFSIIQHKKVSDIVSAKKMSAFLRGKELKKHLFLQIHGK